LYRDRSLVPAEAIRAMALGFLAERPRRYAELVNEIRYYSSNFGALPPDLMGSSIELLHYQGLIEPVEGAGMDDNAIMRIRPEGRADLEQLLQAQIAQGHGDLSRLALRLKLRFLPLLPEPLQREQCALIVAAISAEIDRLRELRARQAEAPAAFLEWIDRDIAGLEAHRAALEPMNP
jgi:DNA-binding PadR family transcriptional regulator